MALGFIVLSAYLAGLWGDLDKPDKAWIGWIALAIFVPAAVVILRRMFETEDVMRISHQGLYYRYWSDATIPWSEIADVIVWSYRGQKTIVIKLADRDKYPASTLGAKLVSFNTRTAGGDIGINLAQTNLSTKRALRAIEHYSGGRF